MSRQSVIVALATALTGAYAVLVAAPAEAETGDAGVVAAANWDAAKPGARDQIELARELMRRRGGDAAAAAQLVQMSREFDPAAAAELFEALADAHLAAGKLNLAADARVLLLQTHPTTPAAREAALWLTRLYSSSEVAHTHKTPGVNVAAAERGLATYGYSLAGEFEEIVKLARADAAPGDAPVLGAAVADPALRFARAVAARRAGFVKPAAALLTPLKHLREGDPWGDAARVEAWVADGGDAALAPKPLARCVPASAPPRLDGVLDDACWQGDARVVLGDASAEGMPIVRLAYDAKFLYVACVCPLADADYSRDDRPRPRDGDLSQRDRMTLVLDADRDFATGWELTIDSRGWTGDRCWDDAAWNPEWFVASRGPDEAPATLDAAWTSEAAIPWRELAAKAPATGAVWALSVVRSIPGAGVGDGAGVGVNPAREQHWPGAADPAKAPEGPAAFGVLMFE
jgi:hypothetical protein